LTHGYSRRPFEYKSVTQRSSGGKQFAEWFDVPGIRHTSNYLDAWVVRKGVSREGSFRVAAYRPGYWPLTCRNPVSGQRSRSIWPTGLRLREQASQVSGRWICLYG